MIILMGHINFIERKSKSIIENKEFRLDYFTMILIATGVLATLVAWHMVLDRSLLVKEQELALLRQSTEAAPAEIVSEPITGVVWSEWLQKYSTQFPELVRLNKITGTLRDGKKIVLEATGQATQDANRLKRKLIQAGLCGETELKKITQSEDNIVFELECKLL